MLYNNNIHRIIIIISTAESMESEDADVASILAVRQSAHVRMLETEQRLLELRATYHSENPKFASSVFGLDTFHFQCRLLDTEFGDLKRHLSLINNRMYCEYYKLYRLMAEYAKTLLSWSNPYVEPYKDLEPYKDYEAAAVAAIHSNINGIQDLLRAHVEEKERELVPHRENQGRGMNVNSFVMSLVHHIQLVQEKLRLFESHLAFFHELHRQRLDQFSEKLDLLMTRVSPTTRSEEVEIYVDVETIYGT